MRWELSRKKARCARKPHGGLHSLTDEGYNYCEFLGKRFGPRAILKKHKDLFESKDEFLGSYLGSAVEQEWE